MPDQISAAVVRDRYERLTAVSEEVAWAEAKLQVGRVVDVLVAEGEGRKDGQTLRMSGRAPDNRLVHFAATQARPHTAEAPARPGDVVTVEITRAAPHHLVADVVHAVRRTRAGDAWEQRQESAARQPVGVLLGMPAVPAR